MVLAISAMFHCPATAASFDCSHAQSPREQAVCGDPKLSGLDSKLGQVYEEHRALLSPEGARLLRQSQRSWPRFTDMVCTINKDAQRGGFYNQTICLSRQYDERLSQLAKVGQKIGPFQFNRIDLYAAKPAEDGDTSGYSAGYGTQHVAYPQIDNPKSAAAFAWNKEMEQVLSSGKDFDPGADTELDYELGYANERLISLRWNDGTYEHGTAHGWGGSHTENEILTPSLRPATSADFFRQGDEWIKPLQSMFWEAMKADGYSLPENLGDKFKDSVKADIDKHLISPDEWLFKSDGLETAFSAYEGGCYACNPGTPVVPWDKLKPLLAKDAVVP